MNADVNHMQDEIQDALHAAAADVRRRIQGLARRAPASLAPFYEGLSWHLLIHPVDAKRLRDLLGDGPWPSRDEIRAYVEACQLEVILLALHLAGGRVPTGLMALGLGILDFQVYRRIYRAATGGRPTLVRHPARLAPRFDAVTWHRLVRGELSEDDARALARRLLELYLDAFAAGLPEARRLRDDLAGFVPRKSWRQGELTQAEAGAALDRAAARLRRRLGGIARKLHHPFRGVLRYLGENLAEPLDRASVCDAVGTPDTSLSTKVFYYAGDTLKDLAGKLRLEAALGLITHRGLAVERNAELVGQDARALRKLLWKWTGLRLAAVRATLKETLGHPACDAWLRADDGELTDDEARAAGAYLLDVFPGAFTPFEAPRLEDAPPFAPVPEIAAFPKRLAAAAREITAPPVPPPAAPRPETALGEDFDKLREVAVLLARGGRTAERLLATHAWAPYLYRVREIQCMVTTDRQLRQEQSPTGELWADWLRVRVRDDPDRDVPEAEWRAVVDRLIDPVDALKAWLTTEEKRRALLVLPEGERAAAIRKAGSEYCSYLAGRTSLFAEERYHRCRGTKDLPLEETRAAVAVARQLVRRHLPRRSRRRPTLPSAVTDLLALALARTANLHRLGGSVRLALGAMNEVAKVRERTPLGAYVEAEIANLHASILKDEGRDLERAEELADEAVRGFERFDVHLGARTLLVKADIQRLRSKDGFIATVRQALEQLDDQREPEVVETARNNFLLYLLEEGLREDVEHWRRVLPVPTLVAHRASRRHVEGRIELAWGSLDRAEALLSGAVDRFTGLARPGDAEISLLFLAAVYAEKGDLQHARAKLEAAEIIARSGGFAEAAAIRRLIEEMDEVEDLSERILAIAVEAGGCLG